MSSKRTVLALLLWAAAAPASIAASPLAASNANLTHCRPRGHPNHWGSDPSCAVLLQLGARDPLRRAKRRSGTKGGLTPLAVAKRRTAPSA